MSISRRTIISLPLAMTAAGLAPAPAFGQRGRRTVTICLSLEPDTLDPTQAAAASIGAVVHGNILEGLAKLTENGTVVPQLADGWDISADGTRYTFRLKKNVRFHDGSEFDANAVKYSVERAQRAGMKNKLQETLFNNIVDIFVHNVHTVELVLKHPDPDTLFRLAQNPAVILHPDTADQTGQHPVGTGPFTFEQWKRGEHITLKRWPGFRDASAVRMDTVIYRYIADPDEQVRAIHSGDVDILFNIATSNVAKFLSSDRYEVLIGTSSSKGLLALNNRRQPLDDVRVRRAITHAIDRESFIRQALDGRGHAIGSHFAPTDPGYINLTGMYPYDPERSRKLLRAAGITSPIKLVMSLPPTPYAQTGGPVITEALANIGIHLTTRELSWPQWLDGPFRGDFDVTIINHVEPLDYPIYTRPDYYFGYDSPQFRDLVNRHRSSQSPREQHVLFQQIQRHLAEDAVNAWLVSPHISTVVRKGLKGVWMHYPIFAHDVGSMYWE